MIPSFSLTNFSFPTASHIQYGNICSSSGPHKDEIGSPPHLVLHIFCITEQKSFVNIVFSSHWVNDGSLSTKYTKCKLSPGLLFSCFVCLIFQYPLILCGSIKFQFMKLNIKDFNGIRCNFFFALLTIEFLGNNIYCVFNLFLFYLERCSLRLYLISMSTNI